MGKLKDMIEERSLFRTPIVLYFDIETFQYNERVIRVPESKKRPSLLKNMTFSVAVSWMEGNEVELEVFPNFREVFDTIIDVMGKMNKKKIPRIILNAHNTNKYDNHFLQVDLLHFYPHMHVENFWLTSATSEESNRNAVRIKDLTADDKKGIILEKRIKSAINVEMVFFLYGIQFETQDNWPKTNSSIKMLGKKLLRLGVVTKEELKTDFDYLKHNMDEDMTEEQARDYAQQVFDNLTKEELKYIENDVIILAKSVHYYSKLFKGFDYSKRTFTSNILDSYNTNDLTQFQLLNRVGEGKEKQEIRYTDYRFANQNFYDYLKPFYRGGLNFYNQNFLGEIITDGVFSMDIHSSYPYAMHNFKIPTFIKSYQEFKEFEEVPVTYSDDEFSLYQIGKETFDYLILDHIESVLLKQILVKYYSTNEFVNINSYTFRLIENITGLRFESIPVYSKITFETEYFGSREKIEEFYQVKTQGKYKEKLQFNSPYDIQITDELNDVLYSAEEVANSKVNLNGLYGIPALRPYFNLFRKGEDGQYYNIPNGHKNAERNIVFSIFVTGVSLWNLLNPLKYLTQREIDENLLYIDTDSLYMKQAVFHKMPDSLFTEFELGTWSLDHRDLPNFYVLNHKKYCYEYFNEDDQEWQIMIKSGGIPHDSFKTNDRNGNRLPFEEFIDGQFSHGVKIPTLKSIYNKQKTISIYQSITELEMGKTYPLFANNPIYSQVKEMMFEDIRKELDLFQDDALFVDSAIGTFSISDIFPFTHEIKQKEPLVFLEIKQDKLKDLIFS